MKFSFADAMIDPTFLAPLAVAAEDAGYAGFVVPDSLCYPEVSDSKYPYTADGNREFLEDKPFIEPFALIPYLAAKTTTIRFDTFVVKLPMRHPLLTAKQASSVAVLSDNRFGFGVGASPWPEDYRVTDIPWERRGKRMDECIEIVQGLTAGGFFEYHGELYDIESVKICPTPTKPIPILLGGHSKPALRRAARLGDGWMHAGGGDESLEDLIADLNRLRSEAGTENKPFEIHVISMDAYSVDGVKRLEEAGVTNCIIGFRNSYEPGPDTQTLQEKIDSMKWFSDAVIDKLR